MPVLAMQNTRANTLHVAISQFLPQHSRIDKRNAHKHYASPCLHCFAGPNLATSFCWTSRFSWPTELPPTKKCCSLALRAGSAMACFCGCHVACLGPWVFEGAKPIVNPALFRNFPRHIVATKAQNEAARDSIIGMMAHALPLLPELCTL
jgi:hypothetical protein